MRYFVSYTTRNEDITVSLLKEFSKKIENLGYVYIDILNNDSTNKQERVIYELENADVMLLIDTKEISQSRWVDLEINLAKLLNIPIIKISIKSIKSLLIKDNVLSEFGNFGRLCR